MSNNLFSLSKRQLYALAYPEKTAVQSNKHYKKVTRPQLIMKLERGQHD